MLKFITKRIITAVFVLLGVTFLTYAMMMLAPGDAPMEIAAARYGGQSMIDQETIEWITQEEGLDAPFYIQYYHWLKHLVCLDFGTSLVEEVPVWELISSRFGNTFELALAAICIAVIISVPIGIISGVKKDHGWIPLAWPLP